jgi:hypothetical protein
MVYRNSALWWQIHSLLEYLGVNKQGLGAVSLVRKMSGTVMSALLNISALINTRSGASED